VKVPEHTMRSVAIAGGILGVACLLILLLVVVSGTDRPPTWASAIFTPIAMVLAFEYGLGVRILGPLFKCDYSGSSDELTLSERRTQFAMGWFGVAIPGLLLVAAFSW
jgi:hypothetical protein